MIALTDSQLAAVLAVAASASAKASHVPAECIAKAVVLKGKDGFMLALLPASRHIRFGELRELVGRDLRMANEEEIGTLFADYDAISVAPSVTKCPPVSVCY